MEITEMTNDEARMTKETPMTKVRMAIPCAAWALRLSALASWAFFRHSSFRPGCARIRRVRQDQGETLR